MWKYLICIVKLKQVDVAPNPENLLEVPLSLSCSHDFRVTDTQYIGRKTISGFTTQLVTCLGAGKHQETFHGRGCRVEDT